MLPASDLTEILTNLAALNLQPNTAAAVIGSRETTSGRAVFSEDDAARPITASGPPVRAD